MTTTKTSPPAHAAPGRTTPKTTANGAAPADALAPVEAVMVPRKRIVVAEGFNPRLDFDGQDDLTASIRAQGIHTALIVRPGQDDTLVVVDGERRLRSADEIGLTELPAEVKPNMSDAEALLLALTSATSRKGLNPVEEARGLRRLLDAEIATSGATSKAAKRAVARKAVVSQKYLTARLRILDVPEEVHPHIANGSVALSEVPKLADIAKLSPKLAALAGTAGLGYIDTQAVANVVAVNPGKDGLWPARGCDVSKLDLGPDDCAKIDALSDDWSRWSPRFTDEELDPARAAGVLYASDDPHYGYHFAVICDTAMFRQMVLDKLARDFASYEKRIAAGLAQPVKGSPADEAQKLTRRAERVRAEQLAKQARGANLDLGVKLLEKVKVGTVDKDFVELCAYSILSADARGHGGAYTVAELAGAGLRLVFDNWQTEKQLKNGKTKVTYVGSSKSASESTAELEERFWSWFEKAKTPEEMAERLVIALAAAQLAVPEALPMSRRIAAPIPRGRNGKATAALKRLARGVEPASVKQVRRAIAEPIEPATPSVPEPDEPAANVGPVDDPDTPASGAGAPAGRGPPAAPPGGPPDGAPSADEPDSERADGHAGILTAAA